jgi:hypothetical protein
VLLLIAFSLFRPGFWMDLLVPPFDDVEPTRLAEIANQVPPDGTVRLRVAGLDDIGAPREFVAVLQIPGGDTGEQRLEAAGLELVENDGQVVIDNVSFGTPAQQAGLDWDQKILNVQVPANQPWKELMYIPALLLLGLIIMLQRRRRGDTSAAGVPATAQE